MSNNGKSLKEFRDSQNLFYVLFTYFGVSSHGEVSHLYVIALLIGSFHKARPVSHQGLRGVFLIWFGQ